MNRAAKVAVVGATGTVGSQIVELLGERDPTLELKAFGSESSQAVEFAGRTLPVALFRSAAELSAFDIVFLAVQRPQAVEIIQARPGPTLIDLGAGLTLPSVDIALVAPGLTARDKIPELGLAKLLAVPHPAAQVIAAVRRAMGHLGFMGGAVMLSASAGGRQAVSELFQQSADLLNARFDLADDQVQLAFNVFPRPDAGELAAVLSAEIAALLGEPVMQSLDILQVPAFHGSAVALYCALGEESREWSARLRSAPGLILLESYESCAFVDAVGQEAVLVHLSQDNGGAALWCVFDAARLAALTAVWIAEALISPQTEISGIA